jgi:hypothetical protein
MTWRSQALGKLEGSVGTAAMAAWTFAMVAVAVWTFAVAAGIAAGMRIFCNSTVSGFDDDDNDDDDQPGICRYPGVCIIMKDVANRAPKTNKRKKLIKNPNVSNSIVPYQVG